jgi:DNA recombination-dependent growth factor C
LAQNQTLTRKDKKEIREEVRQGLLARAEPRPKAVSLVIVPGQLWAFTARPRELALVEDFAAKLLNLQLEPVNLSTLPDAEPWTAQVSPHFLTRLFLSQLYRQEEAGDRDTRLRICRDVALAKDKEYMRVKTNNLASWPEIGLAVSKGKTIFQAGLDMALEGETYSLQLGSNWTATRVKTPPLTQSGDPDSALVERMSHLQKMFSALDALGQDLLPARQSSLAA